MSLYLKYRPQDFDNFIGQETVKTTLLNSLKAGKVSHAYLFTGPRGTGKTTTARLIAKALNCLNLQKNKTPCGVCENCVSISVGNFVDLIEIDAASNTGVDNIRDLQSKIGFSPSIGKKKVYILDEAHMLSKGAWNALLKTIEEPPSFVHFIFVTTEISKIPETIVSRCISFNFKTIDESNIIDRLKFICDNEGIKYEDKALEIISEQAEGGMRDAISLLEKISSEGEITQNSVIENLGLAKNSIVRQFIKYIFEKDKDNALQIINELASKAYDLKTFNEEILQELREIMLLKVSNQKEINDVIEIINIFISANDNFRISIIPQLPLEIACLKSIYFLNPIKENQENNISSKLSVNSNHSNNTEIKSLHQEKKQAVSSLPELTLNNINELKAKIEELIKTASLKIIFRNAQIISIDNDEIFIETKNEHDTKELSSQKGNKELVGAFKEIFGILVNLKVSTKETAEIKGIVEEKEEEKKGKSISEIGENMFDF